MSVYVSLIVAIIAGVLYLILGPPPPTMRDRIIELCRLTFFAGLFAFLLIVGGHITNLFGK